MVRSKLHLNSISRHEDRIASTLKSASAEFDKVNNRLRQYQTRCSSKEATKKKLDWVQINKTLNEEMYSLESFLKTITIPYEEGKYRGTIDTERQVEQIKPTCSKYSSHQDLANLQKQKTKYLEAMDKLIHEYARLENELHEMGPFNKVHCECNKKLMVDELLQMIENLILMCRSARKFELIKSSMEHHNQISISIAEVLNTFQIYLGCEMKKGNELKDSSNQQSPKVTTVCQQTVSCFISGYLSSRRLHTHFNIPTRVDHSYQFVEDEMKKLEDISIQLFGDIKENIITSLREAMNCEKDSRLLMLRNGSILTDDIEKETCSHRQLKLDNENERRKREYEGERTLTKVAIQGYYNAKVNQKKVELEYQTNVKIQEKRQKRRQLLRNAERVNVRREMMDKKNNDRRLMEEKTKVDRIGRQKRLEKLAKSVPYYSSISSKKADLTKSTVARMSDIFEPSNHSELMDFQQGLKKLHTFTDERLFSDPKFRLAHALHESGKAKSLYSLAIVNQLIPRNRHSKENPLL